MNDRPEGPSAPLEKRVRECFAALTRAPDFDAPELRAYDATDELLIATLAELAAELVAAQDAADPTAGRLVVIGDRHGALSIAAAAVLGERGIRVHQDALLGERALATNAERAGVRAEIHHHPLGPSLLTGATHVLVQLPRSLAALDEIAREIARSADPEVVVLAGGRDKHMTLGMNDVLSSSFDGVTAGRGRRKSRVLTARRPRAPEGTGFPVWGDDPELPFRLAAFGQTFGGATLDHGSRLLLQTLRTDPPSGNGPAARIVDLGCGNGSIAAAAALAFPDARVIATDQSLAAVQATRLTVEAAGLADRVEVHRADACEAVPDGWADLILLNPPFHAGAAVHAGIAHRLIRSCADTLSPGGELRLVFNSHLAYRGLVERAIGPTRQLARTSAFTVLAATRR